MIFAIILLVLLGLSVLVNFSQLAGTFVNASGGYRQTAGPRLDEVVIESNGGSGKIVVIDVNGIISSTSIDGGGATLVDLIKAQLERAEEDARVRAVILRVDSPGGEVLASDEINRVISDFQRKSGKPVIASMGNLAASGGYYISAPCRWIVANELTITGSIGVIMHTWNYRGLMDKVGLRPEVYKSGKFKDMLSGEREPDQIPDEEREMVNALIDETYTRFKEVVEEGRTAAHSANQNEGRALSSNWAEYADGRILSGNQAYQLGFVDELGNFEDAVNRAKEIGGLPRNANLVQYRLRYELGDLLRIFGKSEPPVVKVDLGMDPPKLQAGRLYFLSPTFLH